ncbi:MAG TPA: DUF1572 family protein [Alphaproteobacteria bacterium]|nr:DUF1572 family protein [Alphaproteobacteria bacterium]
MFEETNTIGAAYLDEVRRCFRGYRRQAEGTFAQLDDKDFFYVLDPESNSVAILVKHIAGNLRSRWTDFLTTDGEKPDRDRDQEFILTAADTRAELMRRWEASWETVFSTIAGLKPEDLHRTIYIRQDPHTVIQALHRSLTHVVAHIGQIVYLGKHLRGAQWKTLSVPRGKSKEFNALRPEDRKVTSPHKG